MESEYLNFCTHYRDLALRLHTSRVNSSCKIRLKKKLKKKEKFTYLNYIYRKVFDIFLKFFAKQKIKKPFLFGFLWKLKKKKVLERKINKFSRKKKKFFLLCLKKKKIVPLRKNRSSTRRKIFQKRDCVWVLYLPW